MKALKYVLAGFGVMGLTLLPVRQTLVYADSAMTGEMTMPNTAQEHQAMADKYSAQATEFRKVAAFHRQMLADYTKGVPATPKSPTENPWITKERIHCERYIKDAEKSAADADQFAQFHTMRAKELQGQ
jgi:hypothetical protein